MASSLSRRLRATDTITPNGAFAKGARHDPECRLPLTAATFAEARDRRGLIEPYPHAAGLHPQHTPRGRCAAPKAWERLGRKAPPRPPEQAALFDSDSE